MNTEKNDINSQGENVSRKINKSILNDIIKKGKIKLKFKTNDFECQDTYNDILYNNFDFKTSKKYAEVLDPDFRLSFKTVQNLVDECLMDEKLRVAEGFILLNDFDSPIFHSWFINPEKNMVIDPIIVKLNISPNNVNYFIGTDFKQEKVLKLIDNHTLSVEDNSPASKYLFTERNGYLIRINIALGEATYTLLSPLNDLTELTRETMVSSINIWTYVKRLHHVM